MSFETLKATINSNIVSGLPDGIRADFENNPTLQDIVSAFGQDYIYMGSATVGTSPMTDDNARMYISSGSGEFTAFRDSGNNAIDISEGEIAILKGISGVYEKDVFFSGDIAVEAGSVRINDTGSLMQLQAKYDGSWLTISEFGYVGGDITLQDVQASSVTANSVVINGDVESGYNTEVKDYLCIGGEVIVPQNEYLYADDFVEDRLESTTGEYIPNTASNSLAEIGMDTINDKCVLYNEAITSKEGVIESIIPNSTDGDFDVTRSSYTNRVNRDGFIEQVPPNTASYNYTSGDTHPYLLTEAASTNLLTYPKSFGNSYWTKSGASIESDSSTAGSELVVNGTFDGNADDWYLGTGWAYGTNAIDGTATSDWFRQDIAAMESNKSYIVTYEISNYSAGSIMWRYGTTSTIDGTSRSANGTYSEYFNNTTSGDKRLFFEPSSFTGTIDNVSVKEVQPFEAPKEIPSTNGVELVTNGGFATDSDWTKQSGWTISGGYGVATSCPSGNTIGQSSMTVETGKTYEVVFTVSNYSLGGITPRLGGVSGASVTANGTYTEYLTASSTAVLSLQANSTTTLNVDNVSVKEVTSFSGGGFERDAYKLVEDTSNGSHAVYKNNITSGSGSNTLSLYAKAAERNWILLYDTEQTEGYYFDLTNGVVGSAIGSPDDYSITPMANGWYRLSITTTATTRADFQVYLADADNSDSYTGDGISGLYIAYAQLEVNGYASSLMLPTTEGSTTSRVADVVNNAGNQSLFSSVNSSGVLYADIAANSDDLTGRYISLSDGTTNNYADIYYSSLSNYISMRVYSGGVLQASDNTTVSDISDFHKIAVRWDVNDLSLWVDGVEVATDTSGTTPLGLNTLKLTFPTGSSSPFYGKTNAVAVFDYLSDDEMIRLTK